MVDTVGLAGCALELAGTALSAAGGVRCDCEAAGGARDTPIGAWTGGAASYVPGLHGCFVSQKGWPVLSWYLPLGQITHATALEVPEKLPAAHGAQMKEAVATAQRKAAAEALIVAAASAEEAAAAAAAAAEAEAAAVHAARAEATARGEAAAAVAIEEARAASRHATEVQIEENAQRHRTAATALTRAASAQQRSAVDDAIAAAEAAAATAAAEVGRQHQVELSVLGTAIDEERATLVEGLEVARAREAALEMRAVELREWVRTATVATRRVLARERREVAQAAHERERAMAEAVAKEAEASRAAFTTHGATHRATHGATHRATHGATHRAAHGATHGDGQDEASASLVKPPPGSLSEAIERARVRCAAELRVLRPAASRRGVEDHQGK